MNEFIILPEITKREVIICISANKTDCNKLHTTAYYIGITTLN